MFLFLSVIVIITVVSLKTKNQRCISQSRQGVPHQSDKSNSSILAYLNVIIISCTKHLHNLLCIHFDAFWCIPTHSDHLDLKAVFSKNIMIWNISKNILRIIQDGFLFNSNGQKLMNYFCHFDKLDRLCMLKPFIWFNFLLDKQDLSF